ncbi:hypothetical protein P9112_000599 [Eukaryota sp. TZLM1-RC]
MNTILLTILTLLSLYFTSAHTETTCETYIRSLYDHASSYTHFYPAALLDSMKILCLEHPYQPLCTSKSLPDRFKVIQHLHKHSSPLTICTDLNLLDDPLLLSDQGSVVLCGVCELIVRYIHDVLVEEKNEEVILEYMEGLCDLLPSSMPRISCHFTVKHYGHEIYIALVDKSLNTDYVCKYLGLCEINPNPELLSMKEKEEEVESELKPICTTCNVMISGIYYSLQQDDQRTIASGVLASLCELLPSYLTPLCKDIINDNFASFVDLLIANNPPMEVCTRLQLCRSEGFAPCRSCEYGVKFIAGLDESLLKMAFGIVRNSCSFLPLMEQGCVDVVDNVEELIFLVKQGEVEASVVCA